MLNKSERLFSWLWTSSDNWANVLKAIIEFKVDRVPSPNGMLNRILRNLPRKVITFLTKVFNMVMKWQHYSAVWKHVPMISLLKSGKELILPLSYRPISLLDTEEKFFEKILFSRFKEEINSWGLLIRNVLKRRRECGTYLATARRHRRRLKMQKRDE